MKIRSLVALLALLSGILTVGVAATTVTPAAAAVGGPVILGGDDLTDHGGASGGVNHTGWLYIQKALENIRPRVTKSNDGSIAALGSNATGGGAGEAIASAATAAGGFSAVNYFDTPAELQTFFDGLAAGTNRPMIVWISGNGAGNDLGSDAGKAAALTTNASRIAGFVNTGGGLLSHGSEFGWLTALLPSASSIDGGASGDLVVTPAGAAAFPGVSQADFNAGPWHSYFEGDLGGLGILVESSTQKTRSGANAPVVIGGAAVTIGPRGIPYAVVAADGGLFAPAGVGFVGTARLRNGDPIDRNPDGTIKAPSLTPLTSPIVGVAYTGDRQGAWMAQADGNVIEVGNAPNLGDLKALNVKLEAPIVGIASTRNGDGFYLVGRDGGVFALGNAPFVGSLPAMRLPPQAPVVGIALDPDGSGYVLAGRDGGAFAFDAPFVGNALRTSAFPITGIAADPDGRGYLFSASDGGVFAYEATFKGSAGGLKLEGPIVGIAADPDGSGYWLAGNEGGIFAYDAVFAGSMANLVLNAPMVAIVAL